MNVTERRARTGPFLAIPLGVAAGLALMAGCTAAPQAVPDVPVVDDARDVRDADPCALPDAAVLATAAVVGPGVAESGPEGPRCEWRGGAGHVLTVTLFTADGGLATLARNSESTTTRVRLAGYPALETFTGEGEFCQYDIGIAQDQALLLALEGGAPDSCTALQSLAPGLLVMLPAAG